MDTDTVNDAFGGFMELACATFTGNRAAIMAESLADGCAALGDLADVVAGEDAKVDVAIIRRSSKLLVGHAQDASNAAAAAATALAGGVAAHSRATRSPTRRKSIRAVEGAVANAATALDAARREARVAGRLAAGLAAIHEPSDGPEYLWNAGLSLLCEVPLTTDDDEEAIVALAGGDADRRKLAGLIAHVGLNRPSLLVAELDNGSGRYVQMISDDDALLIESVSDVFLEAGQHITAEQADALRRCGFEAPDDDNVNWYCRDGYSVSGLADLLLATLFEVHGGRPGDVVRVHVALAANHPSSNTDTNTAAVALDLEHPNVVALAEALAERMKESIDLLGVDRIWASLEQPGWPYFAHLGSNMDDGLFTEVTGNFYLDDEHQLDEDQDNRLRVLGWGIPVDDPSDDYEIQPRNYTRVWPAPFDLHAACWHVAVTLAAVYGLDPTEPVLVEVRLF